MYQMELEYKGWKYFNLILKRAMQLCDTILIENFATFLFLNNIVLSLCVYHPNGIMVLQE